MMTPTHLPRAALALAAVALLSCAQHAAPAPALPPLTTIPKAPRLTGKFVWADLVTDDVAAAQKFYARLFGWTFQDFGGYLIASNEERPLCGMFQHERPANQPDARPRWLGYISVPSVTRAQSAVTRAGGRVLAAPRKFPERGEQAVFADAEGALFGVVNSSAGDPPDFLADPGDWIWIQLMSRDGRKAATFYRDLAGYEIIENTSTERLSDYVLASEGYARATVRTIPHREDQVSPTWLLFVRVKNVAQAVAQAGQLGGKVLVGAKPDLLEGKVAVIADPTGAAVGLLEWTGRLAKGGK